MQTYSVFLSLFLYLLNEDNKKTYLKGWLFGLSELIQVLIIMTSIY